MSYNLVLVKSVKLRLAPRVAILIVLFAVESLLSPLFRGGDSVRIPQGAWITELVHASAASIARFAIAFVALFATFALLRYRDALKQAAAGQESIRFGLLALHLAAVGVFWAVSPGVYGGSSAHASNMASIAWSCAALAAVAFAVFSLVPFKTWIAITRATDRLWMYSAISSVLICSSIVMSRMLWRPVSQLTFQLVGFLLSVFTPDLVIQPEALRVGTHRFAVVIADECSGLEGIGLLIAFACMWLLLFREEARFPHALVLVPLSLITLFLLNTVRLTALVLIGDAGAREIATGGFHSQAGWILFNSVAFGSAVAARRWSWVSVPRAAAISTTQNEPNPTAAFLTPFLAILAAGMISQASSGSFEWLYPLRFLAALLALWFFRESYPSLRWSWSPVALSTGFAVFLLWIVADRFTSHAMPMPAALAGASPAIRNAWIVLRVLGAVFTVPIAEELAFRGFLIRRFMAADFESVPFRSAGWAALLGSSLLFGLMHGQRWIVASIAGIAFGLLAKKTGRLGDAITAHAVSNALIAVFVLVFGAWQFW